MPPGVQPFLEAHCTACHDDETNKGGLDLVAMSRDLDDAEMLRRWVRVFDRVEAGEMPPKKRARPEPEALRRSSPRSAHRSPPRTGRTGDGSPPSQPREYENTVRDLFQVRAEVAAMLPEDSKAQGFDNIGEALSASTELVEAYLRAADVVIDMVLAREQEPARMTMHSTFTGGYSRRYNAKQLFRFLDEGVVAYTRPQGHAGPQFHRGGGGHVSRALPRPCV